MTLTMKSAPAIRATSRASSWQGLPSRFRSRAPAAAIIRAPWKWRVDSSPIRPGQMDLRPPDTPAMKWLSTRPVRMRRPDS